MIREALDELRRILCRLLASVSRRLWVPPPEIDEICHYAICPACRQECEIQGWVVEFKHKDREIYEVTFKNAQYEEELKEKASRERMYV